MTKRGANIKLSSYGDIFNLGTEEVQTGEQVQQLKLSELYPFKNHPFKVLDDEQMEKTVESIKEFGVMTPITVRPREEGGYEVISGHRRMRASELAGLNEIPAIVKELDDDSAVIFMVDANLQREALLPSERAFAYKMKMEAMRRTAGRPSKNNSRQVVGNFETADKIGEETGESGRQIQRYIRLTELLPELLEMVDKKEIAFNPAVELSYLTKEEQTNFLEAMEYAQTTPSLSQAQRLKKFSKERKCSLEVMEAIMSEEKKGDSDRVTLKSDVLKKYFPKSYTPKQMEEKIISLLEQWQKKQKRNMER